MITNGKKRIPLTKKQCEIMAEFYSIPFTNVVLPKMERSAIWNACKRDESPDKRLVKVCPAAYAEIKKSIESEQNLQSAIFSECAFAQTLANILNLPVFADCSVEPSSVPCAIIKLLYSYNLAPRFVYSNTAKTRMLIQAGGCSGVDSALVSVLDNDIYTIEFKEAGAKTSEPDLPKYGEDGKLILTKDFEERYPQFTDMMKQHIGFNFFENMGHNENDFTPESLRIAVTENYTAKKFADVICTEDKSDYLTMLPANQVDMWANLQGEIRTAGRNHYSVWTPKALAGFIQNIGGKILDGRVIIKHTDLQKRKPRGGTGISGYKINPLFFVYAENCTIK
jgi:hypothetical protein